MSSARVVLIVPRRADGGHRDRLWDYCAAHWEKTLPGCTIVEGHDESTGPFNRSAAINRAAAAAGSWDVAVILDGDVVLDAERVLDGVDLAAKTGRLVLPYTTRQLVGGRGTRLILEGRGDEQPWRTLATADTNRGHVSSCVIVGRPLWDELGGFDERFVGWGGEDDAFHAAAKTLAGVERITGDVWHLHHLWSPDRDHRTGAYVQAKALSDRYVATTDADAMRRLLAEPRTDDAIVLVVLTTGTRPTLTPTLDAAERHLIGPIGRRLIVVDGLPAVADEVARAHPGYDVIRVRAGGYTRAVTAALVHAIGSGQPWVFWLEDDFTVDRPVELVELQAAMDAEPRLAQMSLKRQPWYPDELAAGGIIEANPRAFRQRDGWVEHWAYWTQNPMMTRRAFLATHPWPRGAGSELRFGRALFDNDCDPIVGIWGDIEDPPLVTHIGLDRAGPRQGY